MDQNIFISQVISAIKDWSPEWSKGCEAIQVGLNLRPLVPPCET